MGNRVAEPLLTIPLPYAEKLFSLSSNTNDRKDFEDLLQQCLDGKPLSEMLDAEDQELSNLVAEIASYTVKENATANDLKGFQSRLLRSAVSLARRLKIHSGLCYLALTDDLTGLYNHRGFLVLGMQLLKLARRDHRNLLLFFVDGNHLKAINDAHGHAAGDACLARCAGVLNRTFRRSDVIARYGGDEFVVLALEAQDTNEDTILKRLDTAVREANAGHPGFELSLSVGTARFDHRNPLPLGQMLTEADNLMYAHKRGEF